MDDDIPASFFVIPSPITWCPLRESHCRQRPPYDYANQQASTNELDKSWGHAVPLVVFNQAFGLVDREPLALRSTRGLKDLLAQVRSGLL